MAYKVGDKIQLKNVPKQINLEDKYENTLNDILGLLRRKNRSDLFKLDWLDQAIKILEAFFNENDLKAVKMCKDKFIPLAERLVEKAKIENMNDFFTRYKRLYAFAGRRDLECFIDYMEFEKPHRVLANRRDVLAPIMYSLTRVAFDEKLKYVIISLPPALGKCVKEDTEVYTPNGLRKIKDIQIGDKVYSMKNKEVVEETVLNKWNTLKKQVQITTRSNRKIVVSPEHQMLTLNGYKKAKDITINDYLYSYLSDKTQGNKLIPEDELIYITGMIFEGHCKTGRLSYTGESNEMTDVFVETCKKMGLNIIGLKKMGTSAKSYRIYGSYNGKAHNLLKEYGILDHLCYTKRLPNCFYTMPIEQKYKFISIMFATDGFILKDGAGITLANERLIDDIQFLLTTCGIYSRKREKNNKQFISWDLYIPRYYMSLLKDKCYFYHKQDKFLKLIEKKVNVGSLSVMYPKEIFKKLPPTGIQGGYNEELHIERYTNKSLNLFEKYLKEYPYLDEYKYKDFYWEEITKIEFIDEETKMVDIEVSNTHNFIANGYVSHNSFSLNYYTAWTYGLDINNSNLRLSYSDDLVLGFSRSIKDIIANPLFSDVFPFFKNYGGKPFEKEKESDWKIKNSNALTSHISRTRDGSVTGVRANKTIMFDDMTKGASESTNSDLHKSLYDKWKTEWYNRRDGKGTKFVFAGTMWSPEDILNRVREDREAISPLKPSEKYKYTWESEDGSTIVIRVPLLDENDQTTCKEVYTTEEALEIRDTTDPYLFSCVYQQEPIAPTGLEFAYELLDTFTELPKDENGEAFYEQYSFASLDPARRGKDNVSMPILKKDFNGKYYFVDCIFKQKPMSDLYDEIVDKIIEHNIIDLVIENNTDTSLKVLLEEKLHKKGYYMCNIREKYNVKNKEQRIKDMRGHIKANILFKDKTIVKPNTDYGRFMKNFTTYSFDYANKHDDAPDSLALFTSETIIGLNIINKAIPLNRRDYGI